jgi:uncharacterized membrane protein
VQDTGMIKSDFQFLLVTPLIYFVLFLFTISMLFISRFIAVKGLTKNVLTFYAIAGVMSTFVVSLILLAHPPHGSHRHAAGMGLHEIRP